MDMETCLELLDQAIRKGLQLEGLCDGEDLHPRLTFNQLPSVEIKLMGVHIILHALTTYAYQGCS